MMTLSFVVNTMPPWKQTPADNDEKKRQAERKKALQEKAMEVSRTSSMSSGRCAVSIRYSRRKGKADSSNIIGGILDSLQNIIFENDNQVDEIFYAQWLGESDWYQVTVTELVGR